jgi:hypothetical protein
MGSRFWFVRAHPSGHTPATTETTRLRQSPINATSAAYGNDRSASSVFSARNNANPRTCWGPTSSVVLPTNGDIRAQDFDAAEKAGCSIGGGSTGVESLWP